MRKKLFSIRKRLLLFILLMCGTGLAHAEVYRIYFNGYGIGDLPSEVLVTEADFPYTLPVPTGTLTGEAALTYNPNFLGWKTDNGAYTFNYPDGLTITTPGTYNLFAQWERRYYTFRVHCETGMACKIYSPDNTALWNTIFTDAENFVTQAVYNQHFRVYLNYESLDVDYTFTGFELQSGESYNSGDWIGITSNITITAKSVNTDFPIQYGHLPDIRTYETDDPAEEGTPNPTYWTSQLPQTFRLDADEATTVPAVSPWNADLTFEGWYKDYDLTVPWGSPAVIPAHTTYAQLGGVRPHFYAKWTAPIAYYDQGGSAYSGSNPASLPEKDNWVPHVTLPDGVKAGYTFGGWYHDQACTGERITVAPGDYGYRLAPNHQPVVYAKWLVQINDKEEDSYYQSLLTNHSGETINAQIMRTFVAGMWNTLCLPFSLTEEQIAASPLQDAEIYTFSGINSDPLVGTVDLEVSQVYAITARRPYLIRFSGADIVNPVFDGVTLATNAFTNDLSADGSSDMKFYGTARPTMLPYMNSEYLFLGTGNMLYYSGVASHKLPAFRAYFHPGDAIQSIRPRARIVVQEQTQETATDHEQTAGWKPAYPERKYMENGVLIIERNGVKYNAQGVQIQ